MTEAEPPRVADNQDPSEAAVRQPIDLARAALRVAHQAAKAKGAKPGRPAPRRLPTAPTGDRDPVLFGAAMQAVVDARGWSEAANAGRVFGCWDELVGADLAGHCQPASLTDGVLLVRAESTAWAVEIGMMVRSLQRSLEQRLGPGVVSSITVRGPSAPDWRHGPRRVRGQGPRDTYG